MTPKCAVLLVASCVACIVHDGSQPKATTQTVAVEPPPPTPALDPELRTWTGLSEGGKVYWKRGWAKDSEGLVLLIHDAGSNMTQFDVIGEWLNSENWSYLMVDLSYGASNETHMNQTMMDARDRATHVPSAAEFQLVAAHVAMSKRWGAENPTDLSPGAECRATYVVWGRGAGRDIALEFQTSDPVAAWVLDGEGRPADGRDSVIEIDSQEREGGRLELRPEDAARLVLELAKLRQQQIDACMQTSSSFSP